MTELERRVHLLERYVENLSDESEGMREILIMIIHEIKELHDAIESTDAAALARIFG
jgi:hypothetical protein